MNALSGEQISVERTARGLLRVSGVVDSDQRKSDIIGVLSPVRTGHGVIVDIQTSDEVAARKQTRQSPPSETISIETLSIDTARSYPVDTELRSLMAKRGVASERMDDEMRAYAAGVAAASKKLRRNALALKQIAERFTPAEIEQLDAAKREEWKSLVRVRARAVETDVRALTSQLSQAFPGMQTGVGAGDVRSQSDAAPAAQRLFGLAAAADSQVLQSFAVSTGGRTNAPVRTVQFWRSLAQMAALAEELQKF